MTDLSALIERLSAATGPDRELDLAIELGFRPDGEIARLMQFRRGLDRREGMAWDIWGASVCFERYTADGRCPHNGGYPLPAYTGSIDAALTLVPRHHLWELRQGFQAKAVVWMLETDYDERDPPTGYSTTFPAIALCIAALQARAAR